MAEEPQRYDVRAIRQLLLTAFTAEELNDLFYFSKTPELREVPNQFAPGDSCPTMVRKAVRYCESRYLLGELLAEVKEANPRAYEKFEGTLRAKPAAVAAPEQARPKWLIPALAAGAAVIVIAVVVVLLLKACGNGQQIVTDTPTPSGAPTGTPTSTTTPSEPTPTFTPPSTSAPPSEPTLTPLPQGEREFIVVYGGPDGVAIREAPDTNSDPVTTAWSGDRLIVIRAPERAAGSRWWCVRTSTGKEGWVAEWWNQIRLVKPYLQVGDSVRVVYPVGGGDVSLYEAVYETCNPDYQSTVSRGSELAVIGEPDPTKCGYTTPELRDMGVEFWLVLEPPEGRRGWIADFSIRDAVGAVKPMQIAPPWYAELAGQG